MSVAEWLVRWACARVLAGSNPIVRTIKLWSTSRVSGVTVLRVDDGFEEIAFARNFFSQCVDLKLLSKQFQT